MLSSKLLIKYGGNAMINQQLQIQIAQTLKQLSDTGHEIVLVHGGGPFINRALEKAQINSEFIQGQRQTSPEAFKEIQKTLIGEVNANLVTTFSQYGVKAIGLSGLDNQTVTVKQKKLQLSLSDGTNEEVDLGRVGEITTINPELISTLSQNKFIPVMASIGADQNGLGYNINADDFAGEIAAAIKADYYISLTDVEGLYRHYPDPHSIVRTISLQELPQLYGSVIQGGMIPKIQSCENALKKGVKNALILNGTKPEQLLHYFETEEKIGTTIKKQS